MRYLRTPLAKLAGVLVGSVMAVAVYQGITDDKTGVKHDPPHFIIEDKAIQHSGPSMLTFAPVVKKVTPSVVSVYTTKIIKVDRRMNQMFNDPAFRRFFGIPDQDDDSGNTGRPHKQEETGLGSGVIVSENGYILTNNHVVEDADEIKVSLAGRKEEYTAKVVGTDPQTDIAVLKIDAKNLPAITMTSSDNLQVGDVVLAVGNPFGVGQTVTMGIVSAVKRRDLNIVGYEDFIQTDASINPGNSGGALVDADGRLVGIPSAIYSRSGGNQGIGFAVPVNLARFVMEKLIDGGKVIRGYMGLLPQPITPDLAKAFNLKSLNGALVGQVVANTPAEKAGLKEGDVILEFNNKKVEDDRQLRLMASQTSPGSKVPVRILREGKERTVNVVLGKLPDNEIAGNNGRDNKPAAREDALEGVEVADIDSQARRQYNIPKDIDGALVSNVDPDSPAFKAGLRAGAVILSIDRKDVKDADAAVKMSEQITEDHILLHIWFSGGSRFIVVDESKK